MLQLDQLDELEKEYMGDDKEDRCVSTALRDLLNDFPEKESDQSTKERKATKRKAKGSEVVLIRMT